LSIIPIATDPTCAPQVAISTADENEVTDPDEFYEPANPGYAKHAEALREKFEGLQSLLADSLCHYSRSAFDPQSMSWCVKSFLNDPEIVGRGITWGALFVTAFRTEPHFGGVTNSFVAAPGKIGSIIEFRDHVVRKVNEYLLTVP
jgi:hypothetical protein